MSTQRKLPPEKIKAHLQPAAEAALTDVPEADFVVVVVPWAMGVNYPSGFVAQRPGTTFTLPDLLSVQSALVKMLEQVNAQVATNIRRLIDGRGPGTGPGAGRQPGDAQPEQP